ncbi:hypothetical protein N0V88_004211 [Collariella sp. IMI 366227]|nr:hypothetical protein N0V88_004211 [Collariella sp. IMI 366227]
MASIGPQLPPHLQKRKRTPEDDGELGSPPPKTSRRNEDEISLDDDSDDGFDPSAPALASNAIRNECPASSIGPSLPTSVAKTAAAAPAVKKRPLGPSLPPAPAPSNNDEIPFPTPTPMHRTRASAPNRRPRRASSCKTKTRPRPSTTPAPSPNAQPTPTQTQTPTPIGAPPSPAPPPPPGDTQPAPPSSYTPSFPTHPADLVQHPNATTGCSPHPSNTTARAPDPTKLKSRKFASGPRAATETKPTGVSSIWTETPEEKARRLANAVLGREDPINAATQQQQQRPQASASSRSSSRREPGDKRDDIRIKSYTEQTRGKSLVEEHQAARTSGKGASYTKGMGRE